MKISKSLLASLLISSLSITGCKDPAPKKEKSKQAKVSEIDNDSIKHNQVPIEDSGECCPGCGKG